MSADKTTEPTPITSTVKKTTSKKTPAEPALEIVKPSEPATPLVTEIAIDEPTPAKKTKLTYAQRLALLPPEEAALVRAKANAASKASKARAKGFESPEVAKAMRLNAQLAKNQEKTQVLAEEREKLEAELAAIAEASEQLAVEQVDNNEQA